MQSLIRCGLTVAVSLITTSTYAALFSESFNTDVPDTSGFMSSYSPPWSIPQTDGNVVNVSNGQMQIKEIINVNSITRVDVPGYNPATNPVLTIEADIGTHVSNAWFDTGLDLGEVFITFGPGYAGDGGRGWFKINNLWGAGDVDGTDMGFVPANDVMHHFKVVWTQNTGQYDVTITDGANPSNVFHYLFSNASTASAKGHPIGFVRTGPDDKFPNSDGLAIFDNLVITPEPGGALFLIAGGVLVLVRRNRVVS